MNPEKIIDENLDSLIKLSKKNSVRRNHNILFCCRTHRNYDDVHKLSVHNFQTNFCNCVQ